MRITASEEKLPGVLLLDYEVFADDRGFFYESYSRRKFADLGIDLTFVQDNHSRSRAGVVRGLHYQAPGSEQWRLVRCTVGEIFDVVVDLDTGSATFGQWIGVRLSAENRRQLLIPPAYAHGFAVVSEVCEVQYKCSALHDPAAERALDQADPDLAITWPVTEPITSAKDAAAPSFRAYQSDPDFPQGWNR
ncbi:dTDP-4-dehydrorhamnose 3,5-epimerase [Nocardioides donggukensis]|uniref:dTDP-4-dehydrorhamnose 3,5-epimerase n=1 Tax=Nocardioides donggukensis TaxID=2774019 RepID=A0A927K4E9_9ACTN|nr:dTDP-4-dehydrorhamnose 3,5-epimerase [Nocardioides donggukensis]MBD8870492.1 dTDP-4-dehydrorhamnose 3,5-epimerase [Nocardioides donggukensis]